MAPEVRWAEGRNEGYGVSCDWYTVGVLCYEFHVGDLPYADPDVEEPEYTPFDFKDADTSDFILGLLEQDHTKRLGCGPGGIHEIQGHPYWGSVEWELVPLKKFESPCVGLKQPEKAKAKKKSEKAAVAIATEMAESALEKDDSSKPVADWDFVSPNAVVDEYLENMYRLVSSL